MDDAEKKLPHTSDLPQSSIQRISAHRLSNKTFVGLLSRSGLLSRFMQKMEKIFKPNSSETTDITTLNGRIKELETIASEVKSELMNFKNAIHEIIHPELQIIVSTILDLLIIEIGRDPLIINKKDNTAYQVKIYSRYVESIEKAKEWTELKTLSGFQLEQAIIQRIIKEFLSRIDRDIQVIHDYIDQIFVPFELSEAEKNELQAKLMPILSSKIQDLIDLKLTATDFSVEYFLKWRAEADLARESIFGELLHIIDSFSYEFLPAPKKEPDNIHLAIAAEMSELEQKINELTSFNFSNADGNQRKTWRLYLEKVETEAHRLNSNLNLTHENSERLEEIFEIISTLHNKF